MENPIKMDDLGVPTPNFWFNTHMICLKEDADVSAFSSHENPKKT